VSPVEHYQPWRAIVSASDKSGLVDLALGLHELGWEVVGTSGSVRHLADAGVPVVSAEQLTLMPEMLGGRLKTLDARIFGGLLYRRGIEEDEDAVRRYKIPPIHLVACNFYPFVEAVASGDLALDEAVSKIDVGGPSMIRAAAKNHPWVLPLVDPDDYAPVLATLQAGQGSPGAVDYTYRRRLSAKALRCTAAYDAAIAQYLEGPP
jgi:phosphoribosylaminoimidazolecarboxamide formyltransferase / IMP cyclohydrolase